LDATLASIAPPTVLNHWRVQLDHFARQQSCPILLRALLESIVPRLDYQWRREAALLATFALVVLQFQIKLCVPRVHIALLASLHRHHALLDRFAMRRGFRLFLMCAQRATIVWLDLLWQHNMRATLVIFVCQMQVL
jgi:hypothetical protein